MNKYLLTASELATIAGKSIPAITKYFKDDSIKQGKRVLLNKDKVREYLKKQGFEYKFYYSVQVNLRGASTKSSTTTIVASRLSALGYKVCVLEIDPQASSGLALGYVSTDDDDILVDIIDSPKKIIGALKKIEDDLYLLPSNLGNTVLDPILGTSPVKQKSAIKEIIEELKANGFTAVLVDCPPSLGASVISALASIPLLGGSLLVPTISDVFSLHGIKLLISEAKKIWSSFGLEQPDIKILFSKFDGREKMSLEALSYLQKHSEYSRYLMPTIIKTCSDIPKSQKYGETIFAMSQKSSAKDDFDMVVLELTQLNTLNKNTLFSNSGVENGL